MKRAVPFIVVALCLLWLAGKAVPPRDHDGDASRQGRRCRSPLRRNQSDHAKAPPKLTTSRVRSTRATPENMVRQSSIQNSTPRPSRARSSARSTKPLWTRNQATTAAEKTTKRKPLTRSGWRKLVPIATTRKAAAHG